MIPEDRALRIVMVTDCTSYEETQTMISRRYQNSDTAAVLIKYLHFIIHVPEKGYGKNSTN